MQLIDLSENRGRKNPLPLGEDTGEGGLAYGVQGRSEIPATPPHLAIAETRDWRIVWDISQHPRVKDRITDDHWTKFSQEFLAGFVEQLVGNLANHVLLALVDGQVVGCWIMDAKGDGVFEIHTMLLPECRGADAIAAGKLAMKFAVTLPGVEKLISYCPAHLPEVLLYARLCGFRRAGIAEKPWVKNGESYPMRLVEITRREIVGE
jgi:hypothetical protein